MSGAYLRMPKAPQPPPFFAEFLTPQRRLADNASGADPEAPPLPLDLQLRNTEPDEVRRWIKAWCRALATKPTKLAKKAGLAPSTINRFIKGEGPRNLSGNTILSINAAMFDLLNEKHEKGGFFAAVEREDEAREHPEFEVIWANVIGFVEAGRPQEAVEWPKQDQYRVAAPVNTLYRGAAVVGLEVRGPSMNLIYPPGTVVLCVPTSRLDRAPRNGERVIVYRQAAGGIEASVKEYRFADGDVWLWPRSDDPDHQAPIRLTGEAAENVNIAFVVIGSYRPERIIPPLQDYENLS